MAHLGPARGGRFEEFDRHPLFQFGKHGRLRLVILTVTVTAKFEDKTVFLVEVGQGGIFRIQNVPDEQLEPLIAVACPNILFPYAREAVSDAVARAGFQPIILQPVNFEGMYMQRLQQQAESGAPAEVPIQ